MTTKIDQNSGLVYKIKRPAETRKYTVDFSKVVTGTATITSVQSVTVVAAGKVTETTSLSTNSVSSTGTKVSFNAVGGTDGEDYEVTINCTDTSGDILSDDVMIKVRKAGLK